MGFLVQLTNDAAGDLSDIYNYISSSDSVEAANRILGKIEASFLSLAEFPERGTYPTELLDLGIREYRELFVYTYRMIYRVMDSDVYILLIADGRRDMQPLLERRLISG